MTAMAQPSRASLDPAALRRVAGDVNRQRDEQGREASRIAAEARYASWKQEAKRLAPDLKKLTSEIEAAAKHGRTSVTCCHVGEIRDPSEILGMVRDRLIKQLPPGFFVKLDASHSRYYPSSYWLEVNWRERDKNVGERVDQIVPNRNGLLQAVRAAKAEGKSAIVFKVPSDWEVHEGVRHKLVRSLSSVFDVQAHYTSNFGGGRRDWFTVSWKRD